MQNANTQVDDDSSLEKKIDVFAKDTIAEVEKKNKLLNSTINNISNISDIGSVIDNNIGLLEGKIKLIQPTNFDFASAKKILFFDPIKKYFNNIKKEEENISNLVEILEKESNVLKNDNITLQIECERIKNIIELLNSECEKGELLKNTIQNENLDDSMLEKINKKIITLKEMLIVKEQSLLALELIIKNNKEVISNIERIKNVTVEALNTSVIVAYSLYNQKIILNKISKLKKSDEKLNNYTKKNLNMYKNNQISINDLKESFSNALNTINEVKIQNNKEFPENEEKLIELKKEKN